MSRERACALLQEFGAQLGISQLAFDENGNCCLVFDGRILLNLAYEERLKRFVLFSYLGPAPTPAQGQLLSSLLEANFFWQGTDGSTLSIEKGSRSAVLMRDLPLAGLDLSMLMDAVESFVNTAEAWMGRIEAGGDAPATLRAARRVDQQFGMRV